MIAHANFLALPLAGGRTRAESPVIKLLPIRQSAIKGTPRTPIHPAPQVLPLLAGAAEPEPTEAGPGAAAAAGTTAAGGGSDGGACELLMPLSAVELLPAAHGGRRREERRGGRSGEEAAEVAEEGDEGDGDDEEEEEDDEEEMEVLCLPQQGRLLLRRGRHLEARELLGDRGQARGERN